MRSIIFRTVVINVIFDFIIVVVVTVVVITVVFDQTKGYLESQGTLFKQREKLQTAEYSRGWLRFG